MLTNEEKKILEETRIELNRMLERIDSILVNEATETFDEKGGLKILSNDGINTSNRIEKLLKEREAVVTKYLMKIGLPIRGRGFNYARSGILMILEEPKRKIPATTELYPRIAKEFATTGARVERAIRAAIERMMYNCQKSDELIDLLNGQEGIKPTCSEFLTSVAEKIKLEF